MTNVSWKSVLICLVACLFCSYQFMLQGSTSVMLPELQHSLNLDLPQVGWVTSAFLYTYLIFQIPGGVVADRFSGRWTLFVCCLLLASACFWFSRAGSFTEATMARGFMGIATAPGIVVCMSLVACWFPKRWFPALSGLVESMALLGGALGPVALPLLMEVYGWRDAMGLVAIMGVVLSLLLVSIVRSRAAEGEPENKPEVTYRWSLLFRDYRFWCYCLYGFGCFVLISTFAGLWGIPFLTVRFPESPQLARGSISLIFIGLAIGAPLLGGLVTLFGHCQRFMLASVVLQMLVVGAIIYCDCSIQGMCLLCFFAGMSCGGYMLVFSMLRDLAPAGMTGITLAFGNGFMLLGAPVLQPMIGRCLEWLHDGSAGQVSTACYRTSFFLIVACQALALLCILASMFRVDRFDKRSPAA
ncbi:hypothetical protein GZ77_02915 [Endozoicomonas montiporae]|uniref:Major facilitator superfamily (MFS) profile domain-containing protein n=2 Tax=Endozoicomonas montiporae TaxID=1027273 RepID=A0A081NAV7_9GAMM|nr:MFS transporter [Endozoicomonas montiporae]AMO56724.1 transporter, MFS superfamily [Endozoicomonas montiporae CL-33]KEQ15580.1 hypothetical protein GZ77_02915 [Endozoicomonas montiporae]